MIDETITIEAVEELAAAVASNETQLIDLTRLVHNRYSHKGQTALGLLGWWILSADRAEKCVLHLPEARPTVGLLARSGVLFAAQRRGLRMTQNGVEVSLDAVLRPSESADRLPNVDWLDYDELSAGERLRAIPDLEDARRAPPPPIPNRGNRRYDWINGLGAGTALEDSERVRYLSNVDTGLYEPIANVHLWARAQRAIALAAVTRGSTDRSHIVVMDDGLGIPLGLERKRQMDRRHLDPDWRPELVKRLANDDRTPVSTEDLETALLYVLVEEAFGDRNIRSARDGHGLHNLATVAMQWKTRVHVFTATAGDDMVVHVSGGRSTTAHHRIALPGIRGTLIHLMLPTVLDEDDRDEADDMAIAAS